jgi:hypothetical protein
MSRNPSEATPMVYPDIHNDDAPMMPEVVEVDAVDRETLRGWIRAYFNAKWSK